MLNREDIFLLFSVCTITEIDSAECIHKRSISSWRDFTYFLICLTIIFPKNLFLLRLMMEKSAIQSVIISQWRTFAQFCWFIVGRINHMSANIIWSFEKKSEFIEMVEKIVLGTRRYYAPISFETLLECTQVNIFLALIVSGTFFSHFVYNRASSVISCRSQSIHIFGHFYFLLFISSKYYLKRRGVGQRSKTGKLAIKVHFS